MKVFRTGIMVLSCAAAGALLQRRRWKKEADEQEQMGKKYYCYYQLLNHWLSCQDAGKRMEAYFKEEQISSIAIYGIGDLANRLIDTLAGSEITVRYGIDRDVSCTNARMTEIYAPEDTLPKVDAIVITPFAASKEISELLGQRCSYRLILLDEIIYSL